MTTIIDLTGIPKPSILEEPSFEAIRQEIEDDLIERFPAVAPILKTQTATTTKLIQAFAWREMRLRARVNDSVRAVMLAYAIGTDLEVIAADFGVSRLVVVPATDSEPAIMEADERLRRRVQLRQEAFSSAGPAGAFEYHALTIAPSLHDAKAIQTERGSVRVTLMMPPPEVVPTSDLIAEVRAHLTSDDIQPLTDVVTVAEVETIPTTIVANLTLYPGPNAGMAIENARNAVEALLSENAAIGRDLMRSAIISRLHVVGVQSVELVSPATSVVIGETQCFLVTSVTINVTGRGE